MEVERFSVRDYEIEIHLKRGAIRVIVENEVTIEELREALGGVPDALELYRLER